MCGMKISKELKMLCLPEIIGIVTVRDEGLHSRVYRTRGLAGF